MNKKKRIVLVLILAWSAAFAQQEAEKSIQEVTDVSVAQPSEVVSANDKYQASDELNAKQEDGFKVNGLSLESPNGWFAREVDRIDKSIEGLQEDHDETEKGALTNFFQITGIVLAIVALIGAAIYRTIKALLVRKVRCEAREAIQKEIKAFEESTEVVREQERLRTIADVFNILSFQYWRQYRYLNREADPAEFERNVDVAVMMAERAVESAEQLIDPEDGGLMLNLARNNLVYHLVSRTDSANIAAREKHRLLLLSRDVSDFGERNRQFEDKWYSFVETGIYVSCHLGGVTASEIAIARLRELLEEDQIDEEWKKEIRSKYQKQLSGE